MRLVLLFFAILHVMSLVDAQQTNCTHSCGDITLNPTVSVCTSHGTSAVHVLNNVHCYNHCNVSALYPGTCNCSNWCYESLQHGICTPSGCVCNVDKWTGRDCSIPSKITIAHTNLTNNPFGFIHPFKFQDHDKFGLDHPIFNASVITKVFIDVNPNDLTRILGFDVLYEAKAISGTFRLVNGIHDIKMDDVGLKIKGSYSRSGRKKGWKIDFTSKKFPDRKLFGMEKIGFKGQDSGCGGNSYLASKILQSLGCVVQRSSFAELYINQVFYGIYWMAEEIDEEFFKNRYPVIKDAGMYKIATPYGSLEYRGQEVTKYRDFQVFRRNLGRNFTIYDRKLGKNNNWKMVMDLISLLHKNDTSTLQEELNKIFNVDYFLRYEAVHVMLLNSDSYTTASNNYILWENLHTSKLEHLSMDFDDIFVFEYQNMNPYTIWEGRKGKAPLTRLILQIPQFRRIYSGYLGNCIELLRTGLIHEEVKKLKKTFAPLVKQDLFYQLDEERDGETYKKYWDTVDTLLDQRRDFLQNTTDLHGRMEVGTPFWIWIVISVAVGLMSVSILLSVIILMYRPVRSWLEKRKLEKYSQHVDEDVELVDESQ